MTSPLLDIILRRIRQQGPMDLGEYMGLCLGHPEHGYYMTRDPFGAKGDFTTAPEISQLFGEMVGVWLADLWMQFGRPGQFALVECGPGRGTLMADILRATKNVPGFHAAAKICLMEISPVLREAQKRALQGYAPVWIDDIGGIPPDMPVFLVGNEFLDALPIRQLVVRNGGLVERAVGCDENDTLCFVHKAVDFLGMENILESVRTAKEGDILEVSPVLNAFLKSVDILLKKQGGAALFLDYGYTRTGVGDTLQAVKNHAFADIFDTPGCADLTAHVDFENIARIAAQDDVCYHGPVTQGDFLRRLGIGARAARLSHGVEAVQKEAIHAGLLRLTDTDGMGTLFKACALCHDPSIRPAGFHENL